jgi:hypothetical protein
VVELTLINNDGNIIDAVNYATIIALSRYKKPFVGIEGGCIRVYDATEKAPQYLSNIFFRSREIWRLGWVGKQFLLNGNFSAKVNLGSNLSPTTPQQIPHK